MSNAMTTRLSVGRWLATLCVMSACSGSDTDPALLERRTAVAPGNACPAGGTQIQVGADRNGNGVLDDDEVERVASVCNPESPVTVVRVTAEPAGAHCASGGQTVQSGPDRNGNGALDDDEVTATTHACADEIFAGDFTAAMWSDADKVAALLRARVVTGSLTIAADAIGDLPLLDTVAGNLAVAPGRAPAAIDLPALRHVSGSLVVADSDLDRLALPSLTTVGGNLQLLFDPQLAAVALPLLASIGGELAVTQAPALTDLTAPQLASASGIALSRTGVVALRLPRPTALGHVIIDETPALSEVSLPALTSVEQLSIRYAGRLRTLDLSALHACPGVGDHASIDIEHTGLTAIALPISGAAGPIWLARNPALTAVHLVELGGARELDLHGNPQLAVVDVPHLGDVDSLWLSGPLTSLQLPGGVMVHQQLGIVGTGLAHLPQFRLELHASLTVTGNPALVDLRGLSLPATLGSVSIEDNALLADLGGLDAVAQLGLLRVERNPALTSLRGLDSLSQADVIEVRLNPALTSLAGLDHLTTLSNYLMVSDQATLSSLDGTGALREIGGALIVARNPALRSIAGLASLGSIGLAYGTVNGGPSIYVSDDPLLPPADVDALVTRVRHN